VEGAQVTFKTSQPAPKPGSAPKGRSSLSGDPRKKQKAIDRAIAKAEATKRRQSAKAAEKRDLQRAILAELKRRKLPTGQPVKAKREGPPRRGQEPNEGLRAYVRRLSCAVCRSPAFSECAHFKTKRNGGDENNVFPLCHHCHAEQHLVGIKSFQERHSLNLEEYCRAVTASYHHTKGEA
jgi:hypothetical protein